LLDYDSEIIERFRVMDCSLRMLAHEMLKFGSPLLVQALQEGDAFGRSRLSRHSRLNCKSEALSESDGSGPHSE
jgi:hypothetical protein